ncbi:MAG: aldo/keto reductase [Sedimentisphaerales bacterium]|nr:aldo/keto reductase [Sedimentisphaerales bacterium]
MEKRGLGNTDMELTTVGLGTWAIGGPWQFGWGPQDDDEARGAVLTALEHGINWIDTAPVYGLGHSEKLVGEALRQTTHRPYIATKCGLRWNQRREKVPCLEPESIRRECDESLARLGLEVIDLYQMHWPDPPNDFEAGWEMMVRLRDEGKVRYLGVCNYSVAQLECISRIEPPVSLQPPYSMIRRDVEDELLGYCAEHDMGVLAYSPMQRGLLTGKFNAKGLAGLTPDDHRRRSPEFQDPQFGATVELVEALKPIAERHGRTRAQLAVAWVLRRPEVTSAIVGARRPSQIEETVQAADWNLGQEDIAAIEKLLAKREEKLAGRF